MPSCATAQRRLPESSAVLWARWRSLSAPSPAPRQDAKTRCGYVARPLYLWKVLFNITGRALPVPSWLCRLGSWRAPRGSAGASAHLQIRPANLNSRWVLLSVSELSPSFGSVCMRCAGGCAGRKSPSTSGHSAGGAIARSVCPWSSWSVWPSRSSSWPGGM